MSELTPAEIVTELDRHIVGQSAAKRAVAIALRNRWRWKQLPDEVRREVTPRNILMIGPTGVGKTEITRRLAQFMKAPFVKIEATKYTEVGYYGRDVESIIRDLVEASISMVRDRFRDEVIDEARGRAEERLLDLLLKTEPEDAPPMPYDATAGEESAGEESADEISSASSFDQQLREQAERAARTREKFRSMLRAGKLEDKTVEITVEQRQSAQVFNMGGGMDFDMQNMLERIMPTQSRTREIKVALARDVLLDQEIDSLIDDDAVQDEGLRTAESSGIVFIDEIDKVCGGGEGSRGADVSRQGVQRDLLPIVEGTTVQTKHGNLKTDHILFIAAGAFHKARPSDMMPELQGRFPIRVELNDLTQDDFVRILTEPDSSLTRQYQSLLEMDGVKIEFAQDGVEEIAALAFRVNQTSQNIGARRLYTLLEKLLEDVSFQAPDKNLKQVRIDAAYVREKLDEATRTEDLNRFIL
ncbi:MAG: ATP-dependent protease ATPase subunit HslU [Planctomycetota bacterium]|nr:ATP-dependent protease ATPase subunit HslU [Planctomycetota bacterium]MDA1250404.1 ATP-dependent protease ATPase subunit HslU [Planctomycetota bacterium]